MPYRVSSILLLNHSARSLSSTFLSSRWNAVCVFDDVIEHCGEQAQKYLPACFQAFVAGMTEVSTPGRIKQPRTTCILCTQSFFMDSMYMCTREREKCYQRSRFIHKHGQECSDDPMRVLLCFSGCTLRSRSQIGSLYARERYNLDDPRLLSNLFYPRTPSPCCRWLRFMACSKQRNTHPGSCYPSAPR